MALTIQSSLGELLDDEQARAILEKHIPGISNHPQIAMGRGFPLGMVANFSGGLITDDMVKDGAVVVDIGINVLADGRTVGDVDFGSASKKASLITPVPGGVGPVTAVMLMKNGIEMFKQQLSA